MDSMPGTPTAIKGFAQVLEQLSAIAHAKLPPDQHSRLEMGTALVSQGAVFPEEDGVHYTVCSQEGDATHAWLVNGTCPCPDATHKAPQGRCKHWMASLLYKRTIEELGKTQATAAQEEEPLEEEEPPPIPRTYVQMVQGKPHVLYKGLLALAHERGLVRLEADFTTVTETFATAWAQATFADGRVFREAGDASPATITAANIKPHFPRMALTRAKARCLRDALNIGVAAVEEVQ